MPQKKKQPSQRSSLKKPSPTLFRGVKQLWQRIWQAKTSKGSSNSPLLKVPGIQTLIKPNKMKQPKSTAIDWGEGIAARKWDITGVGLIGLGCFSLLGFISRADDGILGNLFKFQLNLFGWGAYVLPLFLTGIGLWVILRNNERLPDLTLERLLGILLLWVNMLSWLHFICYIMLLLLGNQTSAFEFNQLLAEDFLHAAGGYFGGVFIYLSLIAFGAWGTGIILTAWLIIALVLCLDVTVPMLFDWFLPLWEKIKQRWSPKGELPLLEQQNDITPIISYPSRAVGRSRSTTPSQAWLNPAQEQAATQQWVLPPFEQFLESSSSINIDAQGDEKRSAIIEETLASFGAPARVVEVHRGPTITQFGIEPHFVETRRGRMRVRVSKITALADDLALALAAKRIRIQAPVPGKSFVGVEVPNEQAAVVSLREVVESTAFKRLKSPLRFALGENVSGEAQAYDLAAMPHLLIAGATGSGKSVCVNSIISCLLLFNTPETLRLLMVDPKRVELSGYNGIPHLLTPVVVDLKQVVSALQWVTREMDRRYRSFADVGVRNIREYNHFLQTSYQNTNQPRAVPIPYWVVIIDELADLMMLAPDETERAITRLAQLARATGIHLILATQRPSVDVVTGVIKANFPARIGFAVASSIDSRVILDQPGAERLLGSGDMLFQAPDAPAAMRMQGVFVSDREIQRIVSYWRSFLLSQSAVNSSENVPLVSETNHETQNKITFTANQEPFSDFAEQEDEDPLLSEAIDLARRQGRASISMLQRRMRIGYSRAARIIDTMENRHIVGEPNPATGTREILDYGASAPPTED